MIWNFSIHWFVPEVVTIVVLAGFGWISRKAIIDIRNEIRRFLSINGGAKFDRNGHITEGTSVGDMVKTSTLETRDILNRMQVLDELKNGHDAINRHLFRQDGELQNIRGRLEDQEGRIATIEQKVGIERKDRVGDDGGENA